VDVERLRLRRPVQHLRWQAGLLAGPDRLPPGHPRPEPVGRLQRVQRASLAQLRAPELAVDAQVGDLAVGAEQVDELVEHDGHALTQGASERPLQRARVLGHLGPHRVDDLLGHPGQGRAQDGADLSGYGRPGAGRRPRAFHAAHPVRSLASV
jgi:hypothetical protein